MVGGEVSRRLWASVGGTGFKLIRVRNGGGGQNPVVYFTVQDKSGKPIDPSKMARLSLAMSGPTADYSMMISEDARKATLNADGSYNYTFTAPVPAKSTGTYSIGIEGYQSVN